MSNAFGWISSDTSKSARILVLGFNENTFSDIEISLKSLQFEVELGDSKSLFTDYKFVVVSSDIKHDENNFNENLYNYIIKGGGLAAFYCNSNEFSLNCAKNRLLSRFGLSFTYCILNDCGEDVEYSDIEVSNDYLSIKQINFILLSNKLIVLVDQLNPSQNPYQTNF